MVAESVEGQSKQPEGGLSLSTAPLSAAVTVPLPGVHGRPGLPSTPGQEKLCHSSHPIP